MRPGPLEIILIIVIIIAAAVLARIFRGRRIARQSQDSAEEADAGATDGRAPGPRRIFRRTGIAGIIAGVILLIASVSMFRWAFHSYLWAFVIMAIGFVIVFLTRKKG